MVQAHFVKIQPPRKNEPKKKSKQKNLEIDFQCCIQPAPLSIKPFSSLLNPFRHGCSIFCNHPTKNAELKIAIEKTKMKRIDEERETEIMGRILEDIICKYGKQSIETDTVITTPEGEILVVPRPRLVLNLRTTSQDIGRTSGLFSPSPSSLSGQIVRIQPPTTSIHIDRQPEYRSEDEKEEDKTDVIKRRGKIKKKKKNKNPETEKGEKEVVDLVDPKDTMVATCKIDGIDYESEDFDLERSRGATRCPSSNTTPALMESDLFDNRTLRHLRRNLSIKDIEIEFRRIWKRVLQEASEAGKSLSREEIKIDEDLKISPCEPEKWLSYPRTYKRSDSRFDLPINKKILCDMNPLEYLKEYVSSSKSNLILYKHIFNKFKGEDESITGKLVTDGLGEVLGQSLNEEEITSFKELVDLREDRICLKIWIGLCAFSERLFGEKFCIGKGTDCGKREMIEILDFECLEKRLPKLNLNSSMINLLKAIQCS